ncbi:MAG: hypothetical protein HQ472_10130 [Ignavibacteria bacterium]|nr:hypothetical protein [Ignavibacteria bacterium]
MKPLNIVLAGILLLIVSSCTRHADPAKVESLKLTKDDVRLFEMKIPSNWYIQTVGGELIVATSSGKDARRFLDFSAGTGGAKVELRALVMDSTRNIDTLLKNTKLIFEDSLDRYEVSDATLGGKPAKKLSVHFDQEDGEYKSETYFAQQDSVITMVQFAAFGKTFDALQSTFDEILASVKLARRAVELKPKVDTVLKPTGPEPPSDTLRPYSSGNFAIEIPQNFEAKKGQSSGISSVSFFGSRYDCAIQVDVFDASKQKNLDKIIEQNKGNYGGGKATATTLGGQKAFYFSYNPKANIASRAYFTVKGDKMFRITMNWYTPEQSIYLPIFEKCLSKMTMQ